jgi:hypothetical protein
MKLGIIGLPRAGKSTVFDALTKNIAGAEHKGQDRIATVRVPDERVDALHRMVNPQKTIYAQVEYFLPGLKRTAPQTLRFGQRSGIVMRCCTLFATTRLTALKNHPPSGILSGWTRNSSWQIWWWRKNASNASSWTTSGAKKWTRRNTIC